MKQGPPVASSAALVLAAALLTACGCDSAPGATAGVDGGGAGAGASSTTITSVAATTSNTSGSGGAPACDPPKPAVIPAGWVAWTDWSCDCPFWIPGDATLMPPPLQWVPCVAQPVPGIECQQLALDWPFEPLDPIGVSPRFGRSTTDEPHLLLTRQVADPAGTYNEHLVARLDGSIVVSMRQKGSWDYKCTPVPTDINEGLWGFHVHGDGSTEYSLDSNADGLIYGEVGDRVPRVGPLRNDTDEVWSWKMGREWVIKEIAPAIVDELYTTDFKLKQQLWNPSTDPDGLPIATPPKIIGRDIVFAVGNYSMLGIMAYDDVLGVHPLVRWYGDTTQGAGNVGTDGKHLVWTYGEQKPVGASLYPVLSIMAAEYTTDPTALSPKRLRSEPSASIGNNFVVGCGYAAHDGATPQDTLLVRIADGVSWTLQGEQIGWSWGDAIGITCDEVFMLVFTPPMKTPNIARVRIDSLGPGTLPD